MKTSAALLLALLSAAGANAAVIRSPILNLPIPTTFDGIYLDIDALTSSFTETPGWDINLTFGGSEIYNSPEFQAVRVGTNNLDAITNLAYGTTLNAGTPSFSSGFGFSDGHMGGGLNQFAGGVSGYIGFAYMTNVTPGPVTGPHYGWMYVTLTANLAGGVVHYWAYENTPGTPIFVPEPSTYAALAGLGVLGLALLRRRR